ncbi:uncharacterized protein LOC135484102 isoform X2 [Lineus longissimus]|uniref:uncharacterized protein LOC135484102 isoform X2 n=1 Tax=Lineus longissimus TaxID=88925 RepID=UPI002B4CECC9
MFYNAIAVLVLGIVGTTIASPIHGLPGVVTMTANIRAPKPCVAPSVFQGQITQLASPGNAVAVSNISYDATAERVRVYETIYLPKNQTLIQEILVFYKKGVAYIRDVLKGTCVKGTAPPVFPTIKVQKNAKYVGEIFFGKSFFLQSWDETLPGTPVKLFSTWTADGDCYPVSQTAMIGIEPATVVITSYFNMTLGIKDPSVWDIPAGCHSAPWTGYFQDKYLGKRWYL